MTMKKAGQKDKIEIYTLDYCPFCKKALKFLEERGLIFTRHRIDDDEEGNFKMLAQKYNIQGDVTVPQIIVNNNRVGGYTSLMALWEKGEIFR